MATSSRQRNNAFSKRDGKKNASKKSASSKSVEDIPSSINPANMGIIYPSADTAFKILMSARFCAAIWSNISDCDETYNYWDPSHYLLFGKGFQTWEYSPEYALRSYTYLMINMTPAWIYSQFLQSNRLLIFYFSRCLFGLFCALCEVYFYRSVCREFGVQIGRLMLAFLLFSPGMFIASTAFLPSTFSMYMTLISLGAWYNRKYELSILGTALSAILSWPFAGLIGFPIAVDMLLRKKQIYRFALGCAVSIITIVPAMVWFDSEFYGRLVFPTLNIVLYNVFSSHGPDLYGTEPWYFYLINATLNFNFVAIAAAVTPLALALVSVVVKSQPRHPSCIPYWLSLMPLYLWCLVFFIQPHKEERFLFPIYPLICLCGAVTVDVLQKLWFRFLVQPCSKSKVNSPNAGKPTHYLNYTMPIMIIAIVVSSLLGLSRIFALQFGYRAPMDVFMELNRINAEENLPGKGPYNVCMGKEWYRFPSSFFLPDERFNLQFVRSEFRGQLPAHYSSLPNATSIIPEHMNSENLEEPTRYFPVDQCHFLVDSDLGFETLLEPNYSADKGKWTVVKSVPFLNSARSSQLFRAFYIPYYSDKFCSYGTYNLLQSVKHFNKLKH